jgi:hypothetical protein
MPSRKEIITHILFCDELYKVNNRRSDTNAIFMQRKLNEMYEIFNILKESKPDFRAIRDLLTKSIKRLDKEDNKYNGILDDTVNRVSEITKDVIWSSDNIDYTINIDSMPVSMVKEEYEKLQRECIRLERGSNGLEVNNSLEVSSNETEMSNNELEGTESLYNHKPDWLPFPTPVIEVDESIAHVAEIVEADESIDNVVEIEDVKESSKPISAKLKKRYENRAKLDHKNLFCKNALKMGQENGKATNRSLKGCRYCCRTQSTLTKHEVTCNK